MKVRTIFLGYDWRWLRWYEWHKSFMSNIIRVCPRREEADSDLSLTWPALYLHDERTIQHGEILPHLKNMIDGSDYYVFIDYDCYIIDRTFVDKSIQYMQETGAGALFPHLRHERDWPVPGERMKTFSIWSCIMYGRACFENYCANRRKEWLEVEMVETPIRQGFDVRQNPYIDPASCNWTKNGRIPPVDIKGMAVHPVKHDDDYERIVREYGARI